jgi:hypothetical protein
LPRSKRTLSLFVRRIRLVKTRKKGRLISKVAHGVEHYPSAPAMVKAIQDRNMQELPVEGVDPKNWGWLPDGFHVEVRPEYVVK